MDRIDTMLEEFFAPEAPPRLSARLLGALRTKRADLDALAEKFRIEATERGVFRLQLGRGSHGASARARAHAERARGAPREYFAARRALFAGGVDLAGVAVLHAGALRGAGRLSVRDAESVGYRPCRVCRPPRAA